MKQYYIFYKPFNVLSRFSPEGEKRTLADYFNNIEKDIYPVGRLDYDSEGLLLLTNDKQITHQLLEPSHAHPRTYLVQVEGMITQDAINNLQQGVMINVNGALYKTKPALAAIPDKEPELPERDPPIRFRKNIPTSWVKLTLTEGKNRQVRKMTAATGFPTLRLVRYSVGSITIDDIAPGSYKTMDESVKDLLLRR
ncbi:MAG: pseudouridine synthase [Taibaiella sp.]|nr:pseudouridine synthase [Taibaiella sp.]